MRLWIGVLCAALVAGCGDDDDDGGVADAAPADAAAVDAVPVDAGFCPGRFTFTDDYLDSETGVGVFGTTLTELQNPNNTAMTAPNGRAILCLPDDRDSDVSFEQDDHVTAVQTVSLAAAASDVVFPTAYTPANLDAVYTGEGLTRDAGDATVIIDVRQYPGGTEVDPLSVTIDRAFDGSFVLDDQPTRVWFGNVDAGGGDVTFTVTPPSSLTCVGRTTIPVSAGQIHYTTWACE